MPAGLTIGPGRFDLRDGDRVFRLEWDGFRLEPGRSVALTGPSGAGKTLLLELLSLVRAPGPGMSYVWTDAQGQTRDLAALWRQGPGGADLARARGRLFGFVPQSGGLIPFLTVAENIALTQKVTSHIDDGKCRTLIERLGLGAVADVRPGALSIGQRQRTAVARALAHRPSFVVADEPTGALDPQSADRVLDLLLETASSDGAAVILSSHDLDRVARFGIPCLSLAVGQDANGATVSRLEGAPC